MAWEAEVVTGLRGAAWLRLRCRVAAVRVASSVTNSRSSNLSADATMAKSSRVAGRAAGMDIWFAVRQQAIGKTRKSA